MKKKKKETTACEYQGKELVSKITVKKEDKSKYNRPRLDIGETWGTQHLHF